MKKQELIEAILDEQRALLEEKTQNELEFILMKIENDKISY
jgi:hypothetical protein